MVEVDVVAKDKHGHPVADLEPKDFTLLDDGQPQKITRISVERGTSEANVGQAATDPSKPNAQTVFSNTHPGNLSPTVILFDMLNTAVEDQAPMKKGLLDSLRHLKEGTPVALLILGDDLTVVSDFTTNTISLANAANSRFMIRPEGFGASISTRRTGNPTFDAIIYKASVVTYRAEDAERAARTIAALNLICAQMSLLPGRKSLLWISGGLNLRHESRPIVDAIDHLNDANIAVYSVDARGVLLDPGSSASADFNDITEPLQEERELARGDVLGIVARSTGGVGYRNTNSLDGAITQALDDRSTVYMIEYYPRHGDWHGKLHKLEVKTSRPGVHLRYRSSYRAILPPPATAQEKNQMLAAVATSPLEFPGIRFTVSVSPGQPADPHFVMHVPADAIQWTSEAGNMLGTLQVWLVQKRAAGEDLVTNTFKADLHLSPDAYQSALHEGVAVATNLKIQSGAAKVRVLVRDENSGKIGSVDVAVDSAPEPRPSR
jgi:VWFA-related protein